MYLNILQRIVWVFSFLMLTLYSKAQFPAINPVQSNLKQNFFRIAADSIIVDTISIVPGSFSVKNIPVSDYRLDFVKAILYWNKKPAADSVQMIYRVFPFSLNPVAQRMSFDSVMKNLYIIPFEFNNTMPAVLSVTRRRDSP